MNFLHTEYDSEPDDSLEKSMSLVASAISDPSRVSILCALMDGRAWTATELSAMAGIASELPLVEAARAAADGGDFAAYISAQGGANVPRDEQTVSDSTHV